MRCILGAIRVNETIAQGLKGSAVAKRYKYPFDKFLASIYRSPEVNVCYEQSCLVVSREQTREEISRQ